MCNDTIRKHNFTPLLTILAETYTLCNSIYRLLSWTSLIWPALEQWLLLTTAWQNKVASASLVKSSLWHFQYYSWIASFVTTVKYAKTKPPQTRLKLTAAAQGSRCLQTTESQLRVTIPPSVGTKELSQLISVQTWMQTTTSEIQAALIWPANDSEKLSVASQTCEQHLLAQIHLLLTSLHNHAPYCIIPPSPNIKSLGELLNLGPQMPKISKASHLT